MKKATFLLITVFLLFGLAAGSDSQRQNQSIDKTRLRINQSNSITGRANRDFMNDIKHIGSSSYDHYPASFNNWGMSYDHQTGSTYIVFTDCNQVDGVNWSQSSTYDRIVSYSVIDENGEPMFFPEKEVEDTFCGYPDITTSVSGRPYFAFHKDDGGYHSWLIADRYNLGGDQLIFNAKMHPDFGTGWIWPQIRMTKPDNDTEGTLFILSTDVATKAKSKLCKITPHVDNNGYLSDPFFIFDEPVLVITESEKLLHPSLAVSDDGNNIGIIYSLRGADTIAVKYVCSSDAGSTWNDPITLEFDHSECDVTGNGQIDGQWTLYGLGAHLFFNSYNEPCVSYSRLVSKPNLAIHPGTSRIMFGKIDVENQVLNSVRVSDVFEPVDDIAGACCGPNAWSIAARAAYYNGGQYIFIAWIDMRDTIVRNCVNAEIYYSYSTDWGETWSEDINISNTQEDDTDMDEVWLSMAPQVKRDPETGTAILSLSFTWDESQGNSVIDEEFPGEITLNNIYYYGYDTGVQIPSLSTGHNYSVVEKRCIELGSNYPNPFNPNTTITYEVSGQETISLRIFNIKGQLIKTLFSDKVHSRGSYSVQWDGQNDTGNALSSGIYFCMLQSGEKSVTQKMVLLK